MIHRSAKRQLLLVLITLVLSCALIFSPDAYLPMLARAFMLWWAVGFGALVLLAAWRRMWWWALANCIAAPLVLLQVGTPVAAQVRATNALGLRIAHMNVLQPNDDHAEAIASVLATNADLISVQEVSPEWAAALRSGLAHQYPYQHIVPNDNCYGIALFSKLPFAQVSTISSAGAPFIEAMIDVGGSRVRVYAVHATSPISYAHFRRRNSQLTELAERVRRGAMPTLIVGDLNTVHWDGAYVRFCARSGARPINSPYQITWPSIGPLAMIPLDHALVSGGLSPQGISTFKVQGSDHRGLLAEVRLPHAR